ncbi:amidohydrolase family protein [Hufsiella ginkgonis]|uniref:Amidohydrolase family protein n=1 Tax=Hufsiella ginkgonis TaxID=2695274 RepID=A0A7K1Y3S5_9SPHI|nr:amidohydrolase family protein [Hufsiella ginkgonis]MXV17934.1 amidohydrolase family protein [Hufsiella ginkgonis]
MVKSYSADFILPVSSDPVKDGVISVDETGQITGIYHANDPACNALDIEKLEGVIVPGFVNSHCHLELSHHRGRFQKEQGLIPFIKEVISNRNGSDEAIGVAMKEADRQMLANGIVAVGDICNTISSKLIKETSAIYYHNYVEVFCFKPSEVKDIFRAGLDLRENFSPLPSSIVPHAPYSVCKELFRYLTRFCDDYGNIITIHNQESEEENRFFRYKTGGFVDFYRDMGFDIDFFKPQARNSIQTVLPLLPSHQRILFVHNTYTSLKDLYFVRRFGHDTNWCFCPNANLYIEGRLPKIDMFLFNDFNITVGTDSLASNDQLCILSELKTIASHYPGIPFTRTLSWATLNGAKLLGINQQLGSLDVGKKPGLNLISGMEKLNLTADSKVRKLV